jgi:DNA-binding IclR family transcriptional regulator
MPGSIQSIERAAAILRLLANGRGRLGVGEISRSLGMARGTTHGILATLQQVGFVEQERASGKYQLGATLLHLGTRYLDVNELRSRAINWADTLAARSGESVRIGANLDGQVLVVHHVFRPDDSLQSLDVGTLLPLHATAIGKVLLAFDANTAAALPAGDLEPFSHRTIRSRSALLRSLNAVRERGWASEVEELSVGRSSVAAPIRSYGGLVVGAIGLAGETDRICDTHGVPRQVLVTQVCASARAISRELGGSR